MGVESTSSTSSSSPLDRLSGMDSTATSSRFGNNSFNRLYSSASPGAAGVVEVVPRTQQPRNIRHSRNSNKIGDMSDTMLSSSMNSWMYQSQSNNSEEMKRSNLIHTASNLTRKLIALDKDSDMKTEAKRRKSSQIRF